MLIYPELNPIALKIGPLAIHWYGIMYIIGFVGGWGLLHLRRHRVQPKWTSDEIGDLVIYVALGVILGGRLGYVFFYNLGFYLQHPLQILATWDGGMSFHGGLIGVAIAIALYAYKNHRHFFDITDFVIPVVPVGLAAGRLGNFINGELWGKVAYLPWTVRLPCDDPRFVNYCNGATTGYSPPHHPSQLYECLLEGIVSFIVLWWFSSQPRPRMAVSGLFGLLYGMFRFAIEFVRIPDAQLGYLAFGWLTMGQVLSLPLIIIGITLLTRAYIIKESKQRKA
ncbi:MAG TPA: prolipoprotein diacylglyceryl transferase [Crinalium sp.]|jgi:phosphatidylglycerol:prolipoprotein diacylglycerol transferase